MSNSLEKSRVRILLGGILFVVLILVGKLYLLQIVHNKSFEDKADRQYSRPSGHIFDRGSILFTTKDGDHIDAASLKTGYDVTINPLNISEPADVYNNLSFVIDLDEEDYFDSALKEDDSYEVIAKRIPKDQAEKIQDLNLKGVSLYKDRWRFYPGKELASHLLGFVSFKGDELRGQYGLERYYNDILEKKDDNLYANFFVEILTGIGDTISGRDQTGSVVTSIEPTVQTFVEEEVENVRKKWGSRKAGVIVMNPNTGEVYAMALSPSFDLNTFGDTDDISIFNNDLVEDVYEMGSIVKPLTMAIGLDTNSVTPNTTYDDKGSMTLNGSTFSNYDGKARGIVDMQAVLNNSLNTGVAFVVQKVGNDVFSDYMKKLLGEETGIDLPNEAAPLVANLDSPRDIEHATASFGQGIAISPIAITRALATLGNGGYLVDPHVVNEIRYDTGLSKDIKPNKPKQIFSEETSEEISRMLVKVVDEALGGGNVELKNHTIAAKTGTAQMADGKGGYYEDRYLHSFFGYFPAFEPKFIVFLYNIEPNGAQYASQTLTDPFLNIAKFLINYYEIPPDR